MMRLTSLTLPLLAATALAGCAIGIASPQAVQLDRDLLSVRMSTGGTCLGPAPVADPASETGWSGRLQDCPFPYPYTVTMDPGTNPLRLILDEVLGVVGADNLLEPLATVTITTPSGRVHVFETPDRIARDDN